MVHITCTTLVVLGVDVIYVIVALTRHNCKQSLYVYILYHFIKEGFIVMVLVPLAFKFRAKTRKKIMSMKT